MRKNDILALVNEITTCGELEKQYKAKSFRVDTYKFENNLYELGYDNDNLCKVTEYTKREVNEVWLKDLK